MEITSINSVRNLALKHKFKLLVLLILLAATFLRFYEFNNHWGIGNDDARDALIGREALARNELPIMGSFSSAGPFAFGPLFYWVIMLSYILMPWTFLAPWIFTGLTGIATVAILIQCGKVIGGKKLAIIVGLLSATSPQLVIRSLSLGQHTYVAFFASLLLLSYLLVFKHKKTVYALGMGLSLGFALGMHYQAINLLIFTPAVLFIPETSIKKKLLLSIAVAVGLIIPSLPTIYWESGQQFANTRNILDYLLIGQNRLYVPNSWRLFITNYYPQYWSFVLGGYIQLGFILMLSTAGVLAYATIKKQLQRSLILLSAIFGILTLVNRYYKGERSEGYLLYLLPLILFFTAYTLYYLVTVTTKNTKVTITVQLIGATLAIATILGNSYYYIKNYLPYESAVGTYMVTVNELKEKYPNKKFSVYDYKWQHSYHSQPLSFLLEREGKIDKNGVPIGFVCKKECDPKYKQILVSNGLPLMDLSNENLESKEWVNVNQASMYDDLMKWSKTEKLQSNFKF